MKNMEMYFLVLKDVYETVSEDCSVYPAVC